MRAKGWAAEAFWRIAVLSVCSIVFSVSAMAYIPPSRFIVKSIAAKHAAFAGVQVKSRVTLFEDSKATQNKFNVTSVFNINDGRLLTVISDLNDVKLFSGERKVSSTPTAAHLLLSGSSKVLTQALAAQGVPIGPVEAIAEEEGEALPHGGSGEGMVLSRWRDSIAWVVGGAKQSGQLWIEKDTFLPLRLITGNESDSTRAEIRFESYRTYKEFQFPHVVSLFRRGAAVLQEESLEVAVYPASKGFKIPPFPGLKIAGEGQFTEEGKSAPRAMKEAIQQYYEFIR